jgi:hypothetical protein
MRLLRAGHHPSPPPEGEGVKAELSLFLPPIPAEGVHAAFPVLLPPPLGEGRGGGSPANTSQDHHP